MAFSIGAISYTISKLISVFHTSGIAPLSTKKDESALLNLSENLLNVNEVVFDEQKVAEIFGQTKPLTEGSVDANSGNTYDTTDNNLINQLGEFSTDPVKQKEAETVVITVDSPAELYEEVTITEYFLKYNQDYGDLNNIRMRNNYVINSARLNSRSRKQAQNTQKENNEIAERNKSEQLQSDEKRLNDLKSQKEFAEKYTKLINGKN